MRPHFQPIIDLASGKAIGREALMRGKLGTVEVRGAEFAAAEAHDALFSFDYRARTAALEIGLPLMPEDEILFVNLDPRAALDVESSLRTTWPVVGRLGADPSRICLEVVKPERCPDRELLREMVDAHRKRGSRVALDDLSGGTESLQCLEALRPDFGKIDGALTAGIQHSSARRAAGRGARRLRPRARLQGGRRGHRARRRVRDDARPRSRPRPGLLLRPADREADGGRSALGATADVTSPGGRRLATTGRRNPSLSRVSERDLFANFERMRREMDELFGARGRGGRRRPARCHLRR